MIKVLVIDDEMDVLIVLREILTRAGFEVRIAENGMEGLELLRQERADIVITDIIMPGMDGVATVRAIRNEFPGTRVLVISGGGNIAPMEYEPAAIKTSAYLASAAKAGADLTLTKPFDRNELIEAVRSLTTD
ncbi:MAG: response regulator [Gammaproteobacteria bacterium]|nr:response regulator [Gammaproteobacteria bacterium]